MQLHCVSRWNVHTLLKTLLPLLPAALFFQTPFLLEESKFINVFITDLYSPVVKPALCSAMLEVLRWASHNSMSKPTPWKWDVSVSRREWVCSTRDTRTHVNHFGTQAEKCRGCLWQKHFRQTQLGTAPAIMTKSVSEFLVSKVG